MKKTLVLCLIILFAGVLGVSAVRADDGSFDLLSASIICDIDSMGNYGAIFSYIIAYHVSSGDVFAEYMSIPGGGTFGGWGPIAGGDYTRTDNGWAYFGGTAVHIQFPYTVTLRFRLNPVGATDNNADGVVDGQPLDTASAQALCTRLGPAASIVITNDDSGGSDAGFDPGDGRINPDAGALVAIYCQGADVQVYTINDESQGELALTVPHSAFDGDAPAQNTLIASAGEIALYRLTTGELQLNAPYAHEDKWYAFVWDTCPQTTTHHADW